MNTSMLLTAVLRHRRSQWTLPPKQAARDSAAEDATSSGPPPGSELRARRGNEAAHPRR